MARSVPRQNRHKSVQIVGTPPEFLDACRRRFGPISFDLAANSRNHVADRWFGPGSKYPDAFAVPAWPRLRASWAWLNPPFGEITRWVRRLAAEAREGTRTLFLVPAAVGSDWFNEHVRPNAYVLELAPRIQFVGQGNGFPKDLVLAVFTPERLTGRQYWRWQPRRPRRWTGRAAIGVQLGPERQTGLPV